MESNLKHSPSDKSYSPPGSRGSTRDTTPDFDLSALLTFSNLGIGGGSRPSLMNARLGRYKSPHMMFRPSNYHLEDPNPAAPRRVDAPSWRGDYGMETVWSHGHGHCHSLSSASGPEYMVLGSPVSERQVPVIGRESGVDTTGFYAYCLDRGNGNYTRLIPADLLPPLVGIPAVQDGTDGMLALPPPRGLDHKNLVGNPVQPVEFKTTLPSPAPASDALQRRIDHIVASSPTPPKKPKIYCDKWVHEGVCAFTQQGCKYKHEMPLDKATQNSLGLFHGLPAWWKKQQAGLQRQQSLVLPERNSEAEAFVDARLQQRGDTVPPIKSEKGFADPARALQSWRRVEGVKLEPQGQMSSVSSAGQTGGYRMSAEPRSAYHQNIDSPTSSCVWGPIGPPSKQTSGQNQMYHQSLSNFGTPNDFALLNPLENMDGRDDILQYESS